MTYEHILSMVEEFCNRASEGEVVTQSIQVNQVAGTLVYVRNGDEDYRDMLSKMFRVADAYKELPCHERRTRLQAL